MDIYFCDQTVHSTIFEELHFEDLSDIEMPEVSPPSVLSFVGENEQYSQRQQDDYTYYWLSKVLN